MGLLDAWSRRRLAARREGRIEFLGEQLGSVEDTLKRELILEFSTRPDVRRAYLARVGFQPENETVVALCVLSDRPDEALFQRASQVFARAFAKEVFLDMFFITTEQDVHLSRVCQPFYPRAN